MWTRASAPRSTRTDQAVRVIFGGFYGDTEITEFNEFYYPASADVDFGQGFGDTLPAGMYRRNDLTRTDKRTGLFGEVELDFLTDFTLTAGARFYDAEIDLKGSTTVSFYDKTLLPLPVPGRTDLDTVFAGEGDAPDKAEEDGVVGKLALSYALSDEVLFYGAWSEGFRPGLLNVIGGSAVVESADGRFFGIPPGPDGFAANCATVGGALGRYNPAEVCAREPFYIIPYAVETDEVTNAEFGWKADLFNDTLRFNASIFAVDIKNMQITISGRFSDNAGNAEIKGAVGEALWRPHAWPGLSVAGAFSVLDSELVELTVPVQAEEFQEGQDLAYAPAHRGNVRVRYEWPTTGATAYVAPHLTWSGKAWTDVVRPTRIQLDGWQMLGVAAGFATDQWTFEVYVDNLTDEAAELAGDFTYEVKRIHYARPRTIGARFAYDF